MGRGLGPGSGGVRWCYVCVNCESGLSVYCAWRIPAHLHPVFNPIAPHGYLLHVFVYSRYHKFRLVCLMLSDLD